ncbi:MAG: hypothetical protein DRJ40_10265 [Thermoprotei archaeon]|nr:MAG: hypothetical protein DRJ40_10265 [Thermoprotei archaeon]
MVVVEVRDLWVRYVGSDWVLRGISLKLCSGRVYLLLGPNGCGKTTLLRVLCGFIPHLYPGEVRGEVTVLGKCPSTEGPSALSGAVAYLSEDPTLSIVAPTVGDELILSNALEASDIASKLNIESFFTDNVSHLSSGTRVKVAIASSAIQGAKIILLDEPFSTLDVESRITVARLLKELAHEYGICIVIAEHRLDELASFVDEVIVLCRGSIVARGTLPEVLSRSEVHDILGRYSEYLELVYRLYTAGLLPEYLINVEAVRDAISKFVKRPIDRA